jgi:Shikimate 5-dehydrogenase
MKEFGIIGNPLSHSVSPEFFTKKFEALSLVHHYYHAFPLENIFRLHHLLKQHPFLYGLNVTSPYKQEVIPHLHRLDETAEITQAVNVIKIVHEGDTTELIGYNTDVEAFSLSLIEEWGSEFDRALIFGSGGAAAAAAFALQKLGIPYFIVSRNKKENGLTYEELTPALIASHSLLINATSVGMYPNQHEKLPIPYEAIQPYHYLHDMIYNPKETLFLSEGEKRGAKIQNGEKMFAIQAEKSWEIWNAK